MKGNNYKRLGEYIREVDVRNTDLKVTKLLGLSVEKKFIPSIANTIGTNMANYKVVKPRQFGYGPVTSRNSDKITISIYEGLDDVIISQAYTVFEITDTNQLLPEYLILWFKRPEFDRYARYMSHGSVREIFGWEEMCNVTLPVPPIEEQRKIVAEYETLTRRIQLNEQMIAKLEETAQTLYYKMFVHGIDRDNLPEGWRIGTIGDMGIIVTGKTPSTLDAENFGDDMPFITIPDMHDKFFVYRSQRSLTKKGADTQANKTLPINSICVSCIGTPGLVVITKNIVQTNQQINSIILDNKDYLFYLFFKLRKLKNIITEYGLGAAVLNNLNKAKFTNLNIIVPSLNDIKLFNNHVADVFDYIYLKQKEIDKLTDFQSLLLTRLGK